MVIPMGEAAASALTSESRGQRRSRVRLGHVAAAGSGQLRPRLRGINKVLGLAPRFPCGVLGRAASKPLHLVPNGRNYGPGPRISRQSTTMALMTPLTVPTFSGQDARESVINFSYDLFIYPTVCGFLKSDVLQQVSPVALRDGAEDSGVFNLPSSPGTSSVPHSGKSSCL